MATDNLLELLANLVLRAGELTYLPANARSESEAKKYPVSWPVGYTLPDTLPEKVALFDMKAGHKKIFFSDRIINITFP